MVAESNRVVALTRPRAPEVSAPFHADDVLVVRRPRLSAWHTADTALRAGALARADLVVAILTMCGVVVWWESLRGLPLLAMTDIGVASILPPTIWAGFALVAASFAVALRSNRKPALVMALIATVFVLHGLGVVAEPEMRFHVAWRHIGIADYLRARGVVDPELDAYQNWPAFFGVTAFFWETTGVDRLQAVLAWAPVVFNLLYLVPVIVIGNRVLGDSPLVWSAAWLFTLSNWIGQDYFSPQGWYLFIYLVVLAVLFRWFGEPQLHKPESGRGVVSTGLEGAPAITTAGQRAVLIAVILASAAATVSGHQLTPFALMFATGAAVLAGWCRLRLLPIILMVGTLAWTGYAATAYVAGHPETFGQLGAFATIFEQTVDNRLTGSPGHELVVKLRLLETAALWGLAAIGFGRLLRSGHQRMARGLAMLALSSFPLLAMQSYGGEALMRIAFFALPFMAILATVGLAGAPRGGRHRILPLLLAGGLFVGAFPLTRYGNERMDWYPPAEAAGVHAVYNIAPPGSVITSVTGALPWRSTEYGDHDYRLLVDGYPIETDPDIGSQGTVDMASPDPTVLAEQVESRMTPLLGQRSFLIVSRSQGAELDMMGPFAVGAQDRLRAALRESPAFRTVFRNKYVDVFELTRP